MIYLVSPHKERNIQSIIEDLSTSLYDYVFLDFTGPVTNSVLQNLALELTKANAVERVIWVQSYYL